MSTDVPATLAALFWFNPTLGNEHTESKKLLFFYPPSTHMNIQKDYVGLCEGLHGFTSEISPMKPITAVRANQQVYAIRRCESELWIVAIINHPYTSTVTQKGKPVSITYHSEDVTDDTLEALLNTCYECYRLFNGTVESQANKQAIKQSVDLNNPKQFINYDPIRANIDLWMRYFLPCIRFDRLNQSLPLAMMGLRFLPVDEQAWFTVQYLLNSVQLTFPQITAGCVLYDEELIYSTLSLTDTLALYNCHTLLWPSVESYAAIKEECENELESDAIKLPVSFYEQMGMPKRRPSRHDAEPEAEIVEPSTEKHGDFLLALNTTLKRKNTATSNQSNNQSNNQTPRLNGYMSGPYRQPLPITALPCVNGEYSSINSPMWTQTLPFTLADRACVNSPRIHLSNANVNNPSNNQINQSIKRLVSYHRHRVTVMLVIDDVSVSESETGPKNHPSLQFYDQLEVLMHSTIKKLSAQLSEQPSVPTPSTPTGNSRSSAGNTSSDASTGYRFMYFNAMNLAIKSQLDGQALSSSQLKGLRQVHADLERGENEVVIRLRGEGWVCGGRAQETQREWLLLLDERVSSLIEVEKEIQALHRTVFAGVYME